MTNMSGSAATPDTTPAAQPSEAPPPPAAGSSRVSPPVRGPGPPAPAATMSDTDRALGSAGTDGTGSTEEASADSAPAYPASGASGEESAASDGSRRAGSAADDPAADAPAGHGATGHGAGEQGTSDQGAGRRGATGDQPGGHASDGGGGHQGYAGPAGAVPAAAGLAALSLVWLAAMLWSGQRAVSSAGADTLAITSTALALPVVISASLVSGAATGLAVANLITRRGSTRTTSRFVGAVGAALLTGVFAAVAVAVGYGDEPTVMVLAGTIAAAVTLGGATAGLRATGVVGAVVSAGLAVFAASLALSLFQDQILSLYGAGETRESQVSALDWYSRTVSLASGLAAGAVAFGYLSVVRRRAGTRDTATTHGTGLVEPRWPGYLLAGAGPGLLLLAAEVLTRTAGSRVLTLAGALSEADRAAQTLLGSSRVDHALVVLFVGALTAVILFGRTLGPTRDPVDEDGASEP